MKKLNEAQIASCIQNCHQSYKKVFNEELPAELLASCIKSTLDETKKEYINKYLLDVDASTLAKMDGILNTPVGIKKIIKNHLKTFTADDIEQRGSREIKPPDSISMSGVFNPSGDSFGKESDEFTKKVLKGVKNGKTSTTKRTRRKRSKGSKEKPGSGS